MLPCRRPASSRFSAAQKQTEAIKHIMRRRKPAASTPAAAPQPARRRGRLVPGSVVEPVADRTPSPSRPPPNLAVSAGARGPETGDLEMEETAREMVTAPLPPPEEGRVENLLFRFVSVPLLAQQPAVPKTSIKEQFPQSLGLKRRRVVNRASRDHFPLPLSPGGRWLPKSTPPAHSWNQVRAVALQSPLQVVTRQAVTSLKPGSCVSFHTRRNQVSVTLHTQTPLPAITGQAVTGPGPGPCVPPCCSSAGTSVLVPLARFLGAWLALLRTIRLGYAIQFARRPPKFRGVHFNSVKAVDAPVLCAEIAVLLAKDAIEPVPPADMRSGFYSPYFIVPKKSGGLRPILDLRDLNRALHKLPFKMMTQKRLQDKDVLVRTDNTATVAYINRQGGLRSRRMSQLARHLLLWSQKHLRSLRAIHIPGVLNRAADELSRAALPGEWRLHPQAVQLIWSRFGVAQVDLFASPETTHCQWFYSLTEATLGTDALAHSWPQGLRKYAFPPVSLLAQTLCKIREDEEQVLLVAPYWPSRTWFPELMLLATAPPWPIPLRKDLLSQRRGTLRHPRPDLWKLHVWSLDGTRRF